MKTFNFETTGRAPEIIEYLKSVQYKNISEEQFALEFSNLPRRKIKIGQPPGKNRSPSVAKNMYKKLKKDFGFFQ